MKIGFVIGKLHFSGAEKIARHLISALHREGHELVVFLVYCSETYPEFDYVKQLPLFNGSGTLRHMIEINKKIRKTAKEEKIDAIVCFGIFNSVFTLCSVGRKVPVIACERNSPRYYPPSKKFRLARKLLYPKAAGFVFQTDRIAAYFGKKIQSRAKVIPNFIENKYENLYREDAENNLVLTARLDDHQKNISMLLRAFKRFAEKHDYRLYLVGDGPDEAKFRAYVAENGLSDRVVFTGKQNVLDYLKLAKIYVLPSNFEGMPNSLIEAMASGLPSVATDCDGGGAAYLIEDGKSGFLTPVGDEDAFLNALCKLAEDADLRRRFSEEAYKINDRLEFNRIIDMWVDYIKEVAAKKKNV